MATDDKDFKMVVVGPSFMDHATAPFDCEETIKCANCGVETWTPQAVVDRIDKGDDIVQVWCHNCYKERDSDEEINEINLGRFQKSIGSDKMNKILKSANKEDLKRLVKEIEKEEQREFLKFLHNTEQNSINMEKALPVVIASAIAILKPWDNVQDLGVATLIKLQIDNIILKRRETFGPDKMWDCYSEEDVRVMKLFCDGVTMAQTASARMQDSNDMDEVGEAVENVGCERWESGLDYFLNNITNDQAFGKDYDLSDSNQKDSGWDSWNSWEDESGDWH